MVTGPGRQQGFPPQARLLSAKDFERVYALRRRVTDECFAVNFAPNRLGLARLGLSVGAKQVGNAVARNRVKRTVRESFRRHRLQLTGLDVIVGARLMARTAHNARLRDSLADLWKKIAHQCAVSPAD